MSRLVSVGQGANALIGVDGNAFENFGLIAPIYVVEIRDRFDLRSGIGLLAHVEFTERDEILRFLERERPQQNSVEDAEHCGVGPNPERERQNDNRSEQRLFGKNPQSVRKILHNELLSAQSNDWIDP